MYKARVASMLFGLATFPALAASPTASSKGEIACRNMPAKPIPAEIMTDSFFQAHPDMRWRSVALGEYKKGNYVQAMRDFKRAASYADKFSQSMVAHMYWEGLGVPVDRPLAYAWMDLAAEREYHNFAAQREIYWAQLNEQQRSEAVERGKPVYADYSDSVAKPKMERQLQQAVQNITGSRTGFVSAGLYVSDIHGNMIPGSIYYNKTYYQPEQYWCDQDAYWSRPMNPSVEVGLPDTLPPEPGEP
ncbi:sel1 repeat family protein [Stenotrophomonas sp.]|uniref:sel1 repeat family protein n=1 Tax=Stenotrophomonas sp. TaxID=69392 RepID=UPI0028B1D428|nr:sel1 repeat family protein [Stenotrophomonas sp.]